MVMSALSVMQLADAAVYVLAYVDFLGTVFLFMGVVLLRRFFVGAKT